MWKAGRGGDGGKRKFVCRVTERERNAKRIRVGTDVGDGSAFVGRTHQFGATKTQVKDFISNLRRNANGTHV